MQTLGGILLAGAVAVVGICAVTLANQFEFGGGGQDSRTNVAPPIGEGTATIAQPPAAQDQTVPLFSSAQAASYDLPTQHRRRPAVRQGMGGPDGMSDNAPALSRQPSEALAPSDHAAPISGGSRAHETRDPVTALANAICAAADAAAIGEAIAAAGPQDSVNEEDIGEAFGDASFMSELDRCANKQAVQDAFAAFKRRSVDGERVDAAFARGHIHGSPDDGTASLAFYQGSYWSLGTAGDPPSGQ